MSPETANGQRHVVIVGGGFAGVGCARRLAGRSDVRVTLIDRNNYHQFQPLLYQVATSQLASSDIAYSLRKLFRDDANVDVKLGRGRVAGRSDPDRRDDRRGPLHRRRARARGRVAAELLPDARCGGARLPALLARRRHPAALAHPRRVRGGRPRPRADRPGRAELRRRGRRPDRRGAGGRARRPDPRHDERRVPPPRGQRRAGAHRRPRPHAARAVLRHRARLRREGAGPQGRAAAPRRRGDRGRARAT